MTHLPETTYFSTLQAAKALLRNRYTSTAAKEKSRAYLIDRGWSTKRLIEYESLPYMTQYDVEIKRPGELRLFNMPALSISDARVAIAKIYPDWVIISVTPASHDTTEENTSK